MQRSTEIQGLRALAVGLVLLFHAGWLPGGYIGVDVFYVISGFLITSLIINDPKFTFRNFYARRAKRLLPVAFLVLFVTAAAFWILAPGGGRAQFSKDLAASTWYVSNYLYAHWQNDYQNLGATPSPLILIFTPNASRKSAAPLLEVAARAPCFTTRAPAAVVMMAAVVEIFIVL